MGWLMNWKESGRKRSRRDRRKIPKFSWRDWEKPRKSFIQDNLYSGRGPQSRSTCSVASTTQRTWCVSISGGDQLNLISEIIVLHTASHMKPIRTLCGQNAEFLTLQYVVLWWSVWFNGRKGIFFGRYGFGPLACWNSELPSELLML
jgi:hypothetical protein